MTNIQMSQPQVKYNRQLLAEDMAAMGWTKRDLALRAGVSDMTVIRFLRGESQTAKTVTKLCRALKRRPDRYLIRSTDAVA